MPIISGMTRSIYRPLLITLAFMAGVQPGMAQTYLSTETLSDNLHVIYGGGGNVGVFVSDDGVILIDDKISALSDKMKAELSKITDKPVKFIMNTHWHHDHTGANHDFAASGTTVFAHHKTRDRLITEQTIIPPMTGGKAPALAKEGWPVVTFSETLSFHLDGQVVRAIHVENAHTDGDVLIYFEDLDVIHMGDVYFSTGYPNIDVGSNGTIDGMIEAHERALSLISDTGTIIPGHGRKTTRQELAEHTEMLRTVRKRVKKLIDQGADQADVVAARPLDDLDRKWGQGYVKQKRMVIQAYKSLTSRDKWQD